MKYAASCNTLLLLEMNPSSCILTWSCYSLVELLPPKLLWYDVCNALRFRSIRWRWRWMGKGLTQKDSLAWCTATVSQLLWMKRRHEIKLTIARGKIHPARDTISMESFSLLSFPSCWCCCNLTSQITYSPPHVHTKVSQNVNAILKRMMIAILLNFLSYFHPSSNIFLIVDTLLSLAELNYYWNLIFYIFSALLLHFFPNHLSKL